MKKTREFLASIGLDEDNIELLLSDEQKFDPKKLSKAVKDTLREALENDEDFMTAVDERVRGKVLGAKQRQLAKKFGVEDEWNALPDADKKFDKLVDIIHAKTSKPGTKKKEGEEPDDRDEELERLRTELRDAKETIAGFPEKENALKATVQAEKDAFAIRRAVTKHYMAKKMVLDLDDAVELAMARITDAHDLKVTPKGIVVKQKGSDLDAHDKGGTEKKITLADLLDKQAAERKWLVVNNKGLEGDPIKASDERGSNRRDNNNGRRVPPGLKAAQDAAAARKAGKNKETVDAED